MRTIFDFGWKQDLWTPRLGQESALAQECAKLKTAFETIQAEGGADEDVTAAYEKWTECLDRLKAEEPSVWSTLTQVITAGSAALQEYLRKKAEEEAREAKETEAAAKKEEEARRREAAARGVSAPAPAIPTGYLIAGGIGLGALLLVLVATR